MIKFLKAVENYQNCDPAPPYLPAQCRKRSVRRWGFQLGIYSARDEAGHVRVLRAYLNHLPRKKLLDVSIVRFFRRRYIIIGSSLYTERIARSVRDCGVLDAGLNSFVVAGRGKVGRSVARSLSSHGRVKLVSRTKMTNLNLSDSILVLATDAKLPLKVPNGPARAPIIVSVGNKTSPQNCEVDVAGFDMVLTDNPKQFAARGFSNVALAGPLLTPLRYGSLVLLFQRESSEFIEACAFIIAWENNFLLKHCATVPAVTEQRHKTTTPPTSDILE